MAKHLFKFGNDNLAKRADIRKKISDRKWQGHLFVCLNCKSEKRCSAYQVGSKKYCSRFCRGQYMSGLKGRETIAFKGGFTIDKDGYKGILVEGTAKYIKEHRLVMEKHLGRKLSPREHVHHLDHNKLNNDITNLVVTDAREHREYHPRARNQEGRFVSA